MPWIVVFWCLAHGLELAIKDALKFAQVDEMLLRMYNILFLLSLCFIFIMDLFQINFFYLSDQLLIYQFKHHIDKKLAEYKFSFYRKQHKQLYFDETLQQWNQRLCSGAHWDGRHQRAGQSSPLPLGFHLNYVE